MFAGHGECGKNAILPLNPDFCPARKVAKFISAITIRLTRHWIPVTAQNCIITAGMPVNLHCLTVKGNYEGRGNKALLQLGIDACKATSDAQQKHGDEKTRLLNLALALRERELAGWMSLRTVQMPDGDRLGASMAAMGIANVFLLQEKFDMARQLYTRAER